jgi:hypothetical protein
VRKARKSNTSITRKVSVKEQWDAAAFYFGLRWLGKRNAHGAREPGPANAGSDVFGHRVTIPDASAVCGKRLQWRYLIRADSGGGKRVLAVRLGSFF